MAQINEKKSEKKKIEKRIRYIYIYMSKTHIFTVPKKIYYRRKRV
jgi:hypothetical protein